MGNKKRKQDDDDDDDDDREQSASDSDAPPKPFKSVQSKGKAQVKPKTIKKPKIEISEEEQSSPSPEASRKPSVKVHKNAEGEKYIDLGKKKRAAVRSFKGQLFLDIREYYGTDGDEKPGKKGISLQREQWETLKRAMSTLDSHFAEQG